tara:strand:+ start:58 stop:750 length:693 start_codon:yes stop_codon:yes gene_type:complete
MTKSHSKQFFDFLDALDAADVRYVIIRGFGRLPKTPDTDIDLLYHIDDHDKYISLARENLEEFINANGSEWQSFGSGEWCEMLYSPCKTTGDPDPEVENGCFRIDSYNSLYFKTPYYNFSTYWTVSKEFNDLVISKRVKVDKDYGSYYIPESESEIALLVARNVLDNKKRPAWSTKHISRIQSLISNDKINKDILSSRISSLFPNSEKIVELIYQNSFREIMQYALGMVR